MYKIQTSTTFCLYHQEWWNYLLKIILATLCLHQQFKIPLQVLYANLQYKPTGNPLKKDCRNSKMSYYIPIKQFFCPVTPLNAGEIILMISSWSNHSNKPMSSTISHIDWTTIGCFQSFKLTRDAASPFLQSHVPIWHCLLESMNLKMRPSVKLSRNCEA